MMSEAALQAFTLDLARLGGWLAYHAVPSQRGGRWATHHLGDRGFPDLMLAHPSRPPLFVELKTNEGRLSAHQRRWIETLRAAGADVRVWRPADLDQIETTLLGTRRRPRVASPRPEGGPS